MNEDKRPAAGGFAYTVTEEQVRKYLDVPAEKKLEWLQEANEFLAKALRGRRRAIWEAFRRGTLG